VFGSPVIHGYNHFKSGQLNGKVVKGKYDPDSKSVVEWTPILPSETSSIKWGDKYRSLNAFDVAYERNIIEEFEVCLIPSL
jgi:hypothetical protein